MTTDFSDCQFIAENMVFYTYYDFLKDCKTIKKLYESLNKNSKLFYKWYLFSNTHTNLYQKNCMWDYLNDFLTYEQFKDKTYKKV